MSSHHIVREEQEPALIVLDFPGADAGEAGYLEDLGQLLEWSPLVVGIGSSLEQLIQWGINVDIAVVPTDEVSNWQDLLTYQQPIKMLTTNQQDLVKILTEVINYLSEEQHTSFHLLSHQLTIFDFLQIYYQFMGSVELCYISDLRKISVSRTGNYKKWLNKGERISILPIEDVTYVMTSGFDQNLDNEILQSEYVLETVEEGVCSIATNLKPLMISEAL